MAEYIDLDTPLEVYAECGGVCKKQITSLRDLLDINKISYTAADVVERKHGKWITKYPLSTCSVCEQTMILHDFANYCPNCGADMREPPKEE